MHYPVNFILQCVRWYLAYALRLHDLQEMMVERGIIVHHSTLRRWVIRLGYGFSLPQTSHGTPVANG